MKNKYKRICVVKLTSMFAYLGGGGGLVSREGQSSHLEKFGSQIVSVWVERQAS